MLLSADIESAKAFVNTIREMVDANKKSDLVGAMIVRVELLTEDAEVLSDDLLEIIGYIEKHYIYT